MAISSPGIGSNLDVSGIVSKLMEIEQQPISRLNTREASFQAKISAYGSIMSALGSFQGVVSSLNNANKFLAVTAKPADDTILTASASSIATQGSYKIEVSALAQGQKLVATGQTSSTASIGQGTLTLDFGTISGGTFDSVTGKYTGASFNSNGSGVHSITIDSSNDSLQGIRDAINGAGIGVTASIVNDGSGTPYRLVLSSDDIGVSNSIKISVAESGAPGLAALLAHDPAGLPAAQSMSETETAQDATLTVNGIAVTKSSNSISDVIEGVTFNLLKTTTAATTITVAHDSAATTTAVQSFVKAYNELNKTLSDLTKYDAATKKGGALQGDVTVLRLQSQLRSILNTPLSNTAGVLTNFSQIGISFQRDGTLALDASKLSSAISSNFSDIASLFATTGATSDSLVSYVSATSNTRHGIYSVNITQLGTQGTLIGSAAPVSTTITAGVNDTLDVSVDGVAATVTLGAGVYSAATLATEVQAKINGNSTFSSAGLAVSVTQSGGAFTITSNTYGSASSVAMTGGNGLLNLLGTPTAASGVDVAGTIDGQAASGTGQYLTGSGNADGLKLVINGGTTGYRGTVSYSQGYADMLDSLMTTFLASDGPLATRRSGLNNSVLDVGKQRTSLQARLVTIEANYLAEFTRLDTLISSMTATSSYLTQQLEILANQTSSS